MFPRFTREHAAELSVRGKAGWRSSEVRALYAPLTPLVSGGRRQLSRDDPS